MGKPKPSKKISDDRLNILQQFVDFVKEGDTPGEAFINLTECGVAKEHWKALQTIANWLWDDWAKGEYWADISGEVDPFRPPPVRRVKGKDWVN